MNTAHGGSPFLLARSSPTTRLRVLSLYEGFFAGGARALHSAVIEELHSTAGQAHSVLSIFREMRRESLLQPMKADARYRALRAAGVRIGSLDRRAGVAFSETFTETEIAVATRFAQRSDIVLSLKEQPLRLVNEPGFPRRPVVVCLHRSDPENQGQGLADLHRAVASGRVAAIVCCAESTRAAYQAAGIPGDLLTVVPNGVDLARFRPVATRPRRKYRHELGIPARAGLVVFAARYDGMKNVPLFLAAAHDFLAHNPDGHVIMCGAGMSSANLELCDRVLAEFPDDVRLLRRLHLLGIRDDMPTIYGAADVVALTSSNGEAAPLCLIEGMMCGAIPVATDVGDCSSIVDGRGIITEATAVAVSSAWQEAIARRAEWAPAIQQSRARFSQTRMAAAYAAVIEGAARR